MVIGAAETIRSLAVIGRIALSAPTARVVGCPLIAIVPRDVVLQAHIVIASS